MIRSTSPVVPGLANLRDVGGLPTVDGRRTRPGRLLRSATPSFVAPEHVAALADVGVRLRIDLRSPGEIAGAPDPHPGAAGHDVLLAPVRAGRPGLLGLDGPDGPDADRADLAAHYLRLLGRAGESLARITTAVADVRHLPALVHCTLGKDRTGVVVAVLLSAIGVGDDEVVADYARTEGQTDELLARLRELPGYAERLDALPAPMLRAAPATMSDFLAGLRSTYGDARGYLASVGVPDDVLDELVVQLVEEVAA